ncbi:MAG: SPOR domain-containing protein [Alphaproteobacteria bacterium]|uniref:SPOR domain-containing protein n=1 Tax=Brevundimonas sp. TaxID=1871086 RepID=UPI0017CA5723|nr:SPOR domain-containing protein [Brevundimonas sp.]MBA3051310.1 SPOR domain-containing protein [Brevundimonas sp.]MBU3972678.1 SPOR domain-containing protein [Alphaproteobacteria bacterium]MBU4038567.1 SPOR domain-containing protein [Alphaproteobacteria bacterium]
MTPSLLIRPVVVLVAAVGLNACGMIDSDPHRFENLANSVAAIDLDGRGAAAPARTAAEAGLRPALRVEVMDPHALWDARDGLDGAVERAAPRLVAAAAPAVADAVVQQVSARIDAASSRAGLRPAMGPRAAAAPRTRPGLVQLGAYSSEAAARSAWSRLKSGEAAWALNGLSPVYEGVEVGGRHLVRLKVAAPAAGAAAVCAAAGIDDPWCNRVA